MKSGFVSFIGRPNAGQVDAAQPARRHQARHRLRQAADDAEPDPRRAELPGRAGRVPRHAGHSSAAAPDERADGRRRASTRSAKSTSLGLVVDVTEPPGKGDRFVLDLVKDVEDAGLPDPQQDRSDQEVAAAADHASSTARWAASPRSSRCRRRPATTSIGSSALIIDRLPEGRAAVSGRLPDRPARAVLRRRDRPREAAAVHARRDPVLERRGRRPVRGAGRPSAGCCGCTARSSSTASRRSRSWSAAAAR